MKTIKELEEKLKHPDYDRLKEKMKANKKVIDKIISDQTDFLKRHGKVVFFEKQLKKGEKISENMQRHLIKSALESERKFRHATKSSLKLFDDKSLLKTSQMHFNDNFDEIIEFCDPSLFPGEAQIKFVDMGLSIEEMRGHYKVYKENKDSLRKKFKEDSFETIIKKAIKSIDEDEFPESNEILRKKGIITISGASWWGYVVGAVTAVAGAIVTPFCPPVGVGLIVGGATTIATEAYQDASGTQDNSWTTEFSPSK